MPRLMIPLLGSRPLSQRQNETTAKEASCSASMHAALQGQRTSSCVCIIKGLAVLRRASCQGGFASCWPNHDALLVLLPNPKPPPDGANGEATAYLFLQSRPSPVSTQRSLPTHGAHQKTSVGSTALLILSRRS